MNHILSFMAFLIFTNMVIDNFDKKKYFIFTCSVGALICHFMASLKYLSLFEICMFPFINVILVYTIRYFLNRKKKEERRRDIDILIEEMELMDSDKTPTDEDIELYYKMYIKKWELDHEDEWTTANITPISFEEWEKRAKTKTEIHEIKGSKFSFVKNGGYQFIIGMTMDMVEGYPPNIAYHRFVNYRKLVENEMK